MQNLNNQNDSQIKQYFSMLPPFIQESIQQSGVKFENVEDMQSFVSHLYKKD